MQPEQFNEFRKAIANFHWNNDFEAFCKITGFDPQFQYAQYKWQQFTTCVQMMSQFDDATWEKIVIASLATEHRIKPVIHK